jgi:hypothetical protein
MAEFAEITDNLMRQKMSLKDTQAYVMKLKSRVSELHQARMEQLLNDLDDATQVIDSLLRDMSEYQTLEELLAIDFPKRLDQVVQQLNQVQSHFLVDDVLLRDAIRNTIKRARGQVP